MWCGACGACAAAKGSLDRRGRAERAAAGMYAKCGEAEPEDGRSWCGRCSGARTSCMRGRGAGSTSRNAVRGSCVGPGYD